MRKKRSVYSRVKHWFRWNLYQKWIYKSKCKIIKGGCKVCGGDLYTTPVGYFCKNPLCDNMIVGG